MDISAYIESGIIESYVLGLASAEEVAELETLAAQHPEIRLAVDRFSASLQKNIAANSVTPPAGLKQRIMDALEDDFEKPAVVPMPLTGNEAGPMDGKAKVVPITRPSGWRYVAVAAIILLVISAGGNFYFYTGYNNLSKDYQALLDNRKDLQAYQTKYNSLQNTLNIFQDSAMYVVKMAGTKGKEGDAATVYWDTRNKDVYVYSNKLPQAPAGKQYQLWAIVDGKPVDAGLLGNCDGVCKMKNIPVAQAFAITLEDAGGSPTPHLDQMYVMGKV